ncbi:hypothetical protein HELRODRAFT_171239 [Helobdella robusta]|uniref:Tudor domain-containing protein n=1 Tax=Helobdella robusta TaxID=6412 RepID=T1F3Z4_HELRO|nr:hypothetical protein HELRODRAFT_171239 [Helobdella robusta]ESO05591.1 hypothetical protein HELRODRAFT_171239 [Helobdella robusta]
MTLPLNTDVIVTLSNAFSSPSQFWVVTVDNLQKCESLKLKLNKHYNNPANLKQWAEKISLGDVCALKSPLNLWCRGQVEDVYCLPEDGGDQLVDIRDVDDGELFQGLSPNKSCFVLESSFAKLEFLAVRCRLNRVMCKTDDLVWSQRAIDIFKSLVSPPKQLHLRVVGFLSDVHIVHLSTEDNIDVANALIKSNVVLDMQRSQKNFPEDLLQIIMKVDALRFEVAKELCIPHAYHSYPNKLSSMSEGSLVVLNIKQILTPNQMLASVLSNDSARLEKLEMEMEEHYKKYPSEELQSDGCLLYAFKCPSLGTWQRVILLDVDGANGTIISVDHAYMRSVEINQLKTLNKKFTKFPFQSVCCSLDVDVQHFTLQDVHYLRYVTANSNCRAQVLGIKEHKMIIDFSLSSGDSAKATMLNFIKSSRSIFDSTKQSSVNKASVKNAPALATDHDHPEDSNEPAHTLTYRKSNTSIEPGCQLYVTHINSISDFYAVNLHEDYQQTLMLMLRELKTSCSKLGRSGVDATMLSTGKPVAALFDSIWNRASVLEGQSVADGFATLFFVDLGKIEKVKLSHVRILPESFIIDYPVQCLRCSLALSKNLERNPSMKHESLFKESCEDGVFTVKSSKLVDDVWFVDLLDEENENRSVVQWLTSASSTISPSQTVCMVNGTSPEKTNSDDQLPQNNCKTIINSFLELKPPRSPSPNNLIDSKLFSPPSNSSIIKSSPNISSKSKQPSPTPSNFSNVPIVNQPHPSNSASESSKIASKLQEPLHKNDYVQVVHTNDIFQFFVQKCDDESINIINQTVESLNGQELKAVSKVKVDDLVVAPFDGILFRAVVKKILLKDDVELHFVDYGNDCVESLSSLRQLPADMDSLPHLAYECALKLSSCSSVDPASHTAWFVECCENKCFRVDDCSFDDSRNTFVVDIVDVQTEQNISSLLDARLTHLNSKKIDAVCNTGEDIRVEKEESKKELLADSFSLEDSEEVITTESNPLDDHGDKTSVENLSMELPIKINDNVAITHISSLNKFYINLVESVLNKLVELTDELCDECMKSPKKYKPKVNGEMVAVRFDNLWNRARVVEILPDDQFRVKLIDNGNQELVTPKHIRCISEQMKTYPLNPVIRCSLMASKQLVGDGGVGSIWTDEGSKWFKENCEWKSYSVADICMRPSYSIEDSCVCEISLKMDDHQLLADFLATSGYSKVKIDANNDKNSKVEENVNVKKVTKTVETSPDSIQTDNETPTKTYNGNDEQINDVDDEEVDESNDNEHICDTTNDRVYFKDLGVLHIVLNEDLDCETTIPTDPGAFWCQHLDAFMQMQEILDPPQTQLPFPAYVPREDEICYGYYESYGDWYRVRAVRSNEATADVLLIDYGDYASILFTHLMPLPLSLKAFPPLAFLCTLHGIKPAGKKVEWPVEAVETFQRLSAGQLMKVKCVQVEDDVHEVVLVNADDIDIGAHLVSLGLAAEL